VKVGVLIYTYNRIDDAKINMEIIRSVWQHSYINEFKDVYIVHAYNGKRSWYNKKYLENKLIRIRNSNHFQGASELIDAGMRHFKRKDIDYIIVLAADTWLINVTYINNIITRMKYLNKYIMTCAWGTAERMDFNDVGVATDFFIINNKTVNNKYIFPLRYKSFAKKYFNVLSYLGKSLTLERLFYLKLKLTGLHENIYNLKERCPVHINDQWCRNMYWDNIGLLTHHNPLDKKNILIKYNIKQGFNINKLITTSDLSYYNNGIITMDKNVN